MYVAEIRKRNEHCEIQQKLAHCGVYCLQARVPRSHAAHSWQARLTTIEPKAQAPACARYVYLPWILA
jgi:hypothetical protein